VRSHLHAPVVGGFPKHAFHAKHCFTDRPACPCHPLPDPLPSVAALENALFPCYSTSRSRPTSSTSPLRASPPHLHKRPRPRPPSAPEPRRKGGADSAAGADEPPLVLSIATSVWARAPLRFNVAYFAAVRQRLRSSAHELTGAGLVNSWVRQAAGHRGPPRVWREGWHAHHGPRGPHPHGGAATAPPTARVRASSFPAPFPPSRMHTGTPTNAHAHTHTHTHTHTHMRARTHAHAHTHMHTHSLSLVALLHPPPSQETRGKIDDIVDAQAADKAVAILVSAVYFKARRLGRGRRGANDLPPSPQPPYKLVWPKLQHGAHTRDLQSPGLAAVSGFETAAVRVSIQHPYGAVACCPSIPPPGGMGACV
jgi:hypothetical protein